MLRLMLGGKQIVAMAPARKQSSLPAGMLDALVLHMLLLIHTMLNADMRLRRLQGGPQQRRHAAL
jgi:hypothetical protein